MSEFGSDPKIITALSKATGKMLNGCPSLTPGKAQMCIKHEMETDPTDNKISIFHITEGDVEITSLEDAYGLLKAIHEMAKLSTEEAGHTVYPFYEL